MSRLVHFPAETLERYALGGPKPVSQRALPQNDRERLLAIGRAIERVVVDSYTKHPMRHRTDAEDERRATICTNWFNRLVNQHRWTADRALSSMRYVLDDELSGRVHPLVTQSSASHVMFAPDKTLIH